MIEASSRVIVRRAYAHIGLFPLVSLAGMNVVNMMNERERKRRKKKKSFFFMKKRALSSRLFLLSFYRHCEKDIHEADGGTEKEQKYVHI